MVVVASPARAHAILEQTLPAADKIVQTSPDRVVLTFNEPVEIAFGAIRVYDSNGDRVDQGETTHVQAHAEEVQAVLTDLAEGTYTVTWHVISADSHPVQGAFVFHVGKPGSHPNGIADQVLGGGGSILASLLLGASRWVDFVGLLLLAGGVIFLFGIWERSDRESKRTADTETRFRTRWGVLVRWAWVATFVATIAGIVFQGAVAGGLSISTAVTPKVVGEVLGTRYGQISLMRLALLMVGAAVWKVTGARSVPATLTAQTVSAARARRPLPAWGVLVGGSLLLLLLATPGLAGHAGTTSPVWLNVVTDDLHLAAGAAWAGGLVILLGAALPSIKGVPEKDGVRALAPAISRFSDLATIAVGVIVATGAYRAWLEVGAWRAFTSTTYGLVLLVKLGAFVPLIVLGAINNRWTKPRVMAAADRDPDKGSPLSALRRLVSVEVGLVILILAVTALLVNLVPGRVAAGVDGPFIADVTFGRSNLNVVVDPNQIGENEVHLTVTDASGAPVKINEMDVLFTMPSKNIGPLSGTGTRLAPGHFVVQGRQLSVAGDWTLEVVAHIGRFKEVHSSVKLTVNG
jgi:copper transport protein